MKFYKKIDKLNPPLNNHVQDFLLSLLLAYLLKNPLQLLFFLFSCLQPMNFVIEMGTIVWS